MYVCRIYLEYAKCFIYAPHVWAHIQNVSRTTRTNLFYSLTREGRPFYLRALWYISGRPVESREIRFSRSSRVLRDLITCPFALALGYANCSIRASRNARSSFAVFPSLLLICRIFHRTNSTSPDHTIRIGTHYHNREISIKLLNLSKDRYCKCSKNK